MNPGGTLFHRHLVHFYSALYTGIQLYQWTGVDRIAYVFINGVSGVYTAYVVLQGQALPPATLATEHEFSEWTAGTEPVALSVLFTVPKGLLNLATDQVPIVAIATDESIPRDYAEFTFDTLRWQRDPTLTTFGTGIPVPGQPYAFAISGLQPFGMFALSLDDSVVSSGFLDGLGGDTGSFVFPPGWNVGDLHFLTAQDTTGEFAYSITCPACNCGTWGDATGDGLINPIDVVRMVNFVYKSQDQRVQPPNCPYQAGDVNCDNAVNPVDIVRYVNYVYKGQTSAFCADPCGP